MKNKMTTSELKQYVIAEAKRLYKIEVLKEQKSKIDKELRMLSEDIHKKISNNVDKKEEPQRMADIHNMVGDWQERMYQKDYDKATGKLRDISDGEAKEFLGDWFRYFRGGERIEEEESSVDTYRLEIPMSKYPSKKELEYKLEDKFSSSSHGIEGNPGGWTSRVSFNIVGNSAPYGAVWSVEIKEHHILDI